MCDKLTSWAGPLGARSLQAPGALASADLEDSRATQKVLCNSSSTFFRVLLGRAPVAMGHGHGRVSRCRLSLNWIKQYSQEKRCITFAPPPQAVPQI